VLGQRLPLVLYTPSRMWGSLALGHPGEAWGLGSVGQQAQEEQASRTSGLEQLPSQHGQRPQPCQVIGSMRDDRSFLAC
jgi:hypothetical protein